MSVGKMEKRAQHRLLPRERATNDVTLHWTQNVLRHTPLLLSETRNGSFFLFPLRSIFIPT